MYGWYCIAAVPPNFIYRGGVKTFLDHFIYLKTI